MPEISGESLKVLFLALPGFVSMKVYGLLVPSRRVDWSNAAIETLAYGTINLSLWLWPVLQMPRFSAGQSPPWWLGPVGFAILFVSPSLLAVLTWRLRRSRVLQRWISHPLPTAWDFFFEKRRSCWILFTLRNGDQFGGYFGKNSFASSHPESRDVFVEDLWRVDQDGLFIGRVEGNLGSVVRFDDCQQMQLFKAEE